MRKTILTIVLALITSMALAAGVMAQQKSAPTTPAASAAAKMEKFSGAVDRLDAARKEIVVKKGNDLKTFSWGDSTKFMEGKKALAFADLKEGMKVTIQYKEEGGKLTAERVNVSKPKTSAKKSTEKSY